MKRALQNITMKRMKIKRLHRLMFYTLLCLAKTLPAQEKVHTRSDEIYTCAFREEITLYTDRSLYAVGEEILFKAAYQTTITSSKRFSTVLYMELIKPDGTALVQQKIPLENNDVSGHISIPENLLSGIYYLKAYTKWMRNNPVESYGYQLVKIVNPNKSEVSKSANGNGNSSAPDFKGVEEIQGIEVMLNKINYGPRERVNVVLHANAANSNNFFISVVKKGAKDVTKTWIESNVKWPTKDTPAKFYPEINGVTLSGKVLDASHNKAVEKAEVSMALLSHTSYLLKSTTNSNGEFIFSLPENGQVHDFFINAEKEKQELAIEIDKEFCNKPVHLKALPFSLAEGEKALAKEVCVNTQITRAFRQMNNSAFAEPKEQSDLSFYGKPQKTFFTDTYINVPTILDFIVEIVKEVKFSKNKLVPSYNSSLNNTFNSLPYLLLLDNVPISNLSEVLSIVTEKVDRIELNNFGYVLGNHSYCGIVSVFSKNNDMAGIELPPNSMFFKYSLLDELVEKPAAEDFCERKDIHFPDRRNCLYWNPNLKMSSGEEQQFSFFTSDVSGAYQIIIQAISEDGTPVYSERTFNVE